MHLSLASSVPQGDRLLGSSAQNLLVECTALGVEGILNDQISSQGHS